MSEYDMGKLGVVAPFKAKEGAIAMKNGATAHGSIKVPTLANELNQGDWVELDGEFTVKAITTSGVRIGRVSTKEGKWIEGEPTTDYNQTQAVTANKLREFGIETIFKKILTVDVTGSVSAGNYLVDDDTTAGNYKQSGSSGTTATSVMALTAKDSNNQVVAGFI